MIHRVLGELKKGRKETHWMWFIFPQIDGLGSSTMATRYAVTSLDEAKAYWQHPKLGQRLVDCTEAVIPHSATKTAREIFGSPDYMKFRSCMTLFELASGGAESFVVALEVFYGGDRDNATLTRL